MSQWVSFQSAASNSREVLTSIGTNSDINVGAPITACFTVFVFTKNQEATLFSTADARGRDQPLELLIGR